MGYNKSHKIKQIVRIPILELKKIICFVPPPFMKENKSRRKEPNCKKIHKKAL
jgi:hypothetical protein